MTPEPTTTEMLAALLDETRAARSAFERFIVAQQTSQLMAHPTADPRLSVDQAAEYAGGLHPQTIRKACQLRQLDHERRGPQAPIRIRLSALEKWLSRDRVRALRGA